MNKDADAEAIQLRLREVRRMRMRTLLEQYPSMKCFAAAIGEDLNYVSRLVKLQKTGRKNLGEVKARKIEQTLGLPECWLDREIGMVPPTTPTSKPWPFKFSREIWDNLTFAEKQRAEAMLLTIVNGIEAERATQKQTG